MLSLRLYMKTYFFGFMLCGLANLSFNILLLLHLRKIWHLSHCPKACHLHFETMWDPVSNQTPNPLLSYQSFSYQHLFPPKDLSTCFSSVCNNLPQHLPSSWWSPYILQVSISLPQSGQPKATLSSGSLHYSLSLYFVFFMASPTMYNYVSAGLFYHLSLPPINPYVP